MDIWLISVVSVWVHKNMEIKNLVKSPEITKYYLIQKQSKLI
jgi:hypothetical protein